MQSARSTKSSRKNAEIIGVREPKAKSQHPWAACPLFSHSYPFPNSGSSEGKESICNASTRFWSLWWEDPLEKGMVTHSSILVWRILWTEEPHGYSSCGHKESDRTEWLTLSLVLLSHPRFSTWIYVSLKKKYIPVTCDQFSVLGLPGTLVLFLHLRSLSKKKKTKKSSTLWLCLPIKLLAPVDNFFSSLLFC